MGSIQFLLASLLIVLSLCSSSSSKCNLSQRDALLRIQSPIKGLFWNASQDCCLWNKVACDEYGNVVTLNLDGFTEDNTLLPNSSIFELRFLQNLTLGNSDTEQRLALINASIPNQIRKLTELRNLTVYFYRGPITSSIGSLIKLQRLLMYLTKGSMVRNIPDSIGNLRQLADLFLYVDGLSGSIPDSFRSLTNLVNLGIGRGVSGNLPSFIFDLPNLETLAVGDNGLKGSLPRTIRPDSKLKELYLHDNKLTGILPAWIFTQRMVIIDISKNSFSGPIEPFLMPRVSFLDYIDLSDNLIEGIPTSLFNLRNVTYLVLDRNNLSGALDFELLGGMNKLRSLTLSGNQRLTLKKSINGVRYSPFLLEIYMDHCGLTEFPNFLSSVDSLLRLSVNNNKMKGAIDFGRGWKNLYYLDASQNNLGGPLMPAIPKSITFLTLSHNLFTGKIPKSYCRNSLDLDLSFNKITECLQFKNQCKSNLNLMC